jgi:hypothetical protein
VIAPTQGASPTSSSTSTGRCRRQGGAPGSARTWDSSTRRLWRRPYDRGKCGQGQGSEPPRPVRQRGKHHNAAALGGRAPTLSAPSPRAFAVSPTYLRWSQTLLSALDMPAAPATVSPPVPTPTFPIPSIPKAVKWHPHNAQAPRVQDRRPRHRRRGYACRLRRGGGRRGGGNARIGFRDMNSGVSVGTGDEKQQEGERIACLGRLFSAGRVSPRDIFM